MPAFGVDLVRGDLFDGCRFEVSEDGRGGRVGSMLHKFVSLLRDYAELTKARITTLIVLTAWCGYFFGAHRMGVSSWSIGLVHALLGVALVSSGTAALNEVLESSVDARMRRTALRPLPSGRMTRAHAATVGLALTLGGSAYLAIYANLLTGLLVFLTALVYLAVYTPLKKVSPVCTFVGAFPGAMPVVLGWTAVRGRLEIETLILFAIMFVWQFPHFLSIAWLYREDYAQGEIRMLPVVDADGNAVPGAKVGFNNETEVTVAAEQRQKLPMSPQLKVLDRSAFLYNEAEDCYRCPMGRSGKAGGSSRKNGLCLLFPRTSHELLRRRAAIDPYGPTDVRP